MDYTDLVNKRKSHQCTIPGLINPSDLENGLFDEGEYLEPWGKWHKSIPADILVIGQDWGGQDYYLKNNGKDENKNPTCTNLISLFESIKINIGTPTFPNSTAKLHFTNIIPFIRTGKMQGELEKILNQDLVNEFANAYIKPLISIVKPRIIISLGSVAFKGVASNYNFEFKNSGKILSIVVQAPFEINDEFYLFPMYHCGSSGINRNRNLSLQKDDWSKILPYLPLVSRNA
jgi:hypothetical protein